MEEPHFIKCESGLLTGAEDTANCVPDMLLPTSDGLAAVKVEPHDVFADGSLEEAGCSIDKEEIEIEDFKIETHDEECNTLVDKLQKVDSTTVITGAPIYSCSDCLKTYRRRCDLKRHLLIHIGVKPYCCKICDSSFAQRSHLNDHIFTHSAKRQFVCSVCGNTFKSKSILRGHIATHTNKRPYSCSICGITFRRSSNMKRHEYTHFDSRPFFCSVCGTTFRVSSDLRKHERSHL